MNAAETPVRRVGRFVREHGLGIVFGVLFLGALLGQAFAGLAEMNARAATDGLQHLNFWQYVTSSDFAADVAENWQSEYLQFTLYILLTVWLVQRGSPESKPVDEVGRQSDEQQQVGDFAKQSSPRWARVGGWRTRFFSHSLVIVMAAAFVLSWGAQLIAGHAAYNAEQLRNLQDPLSLGRYALSADFWDRTLQNWQSELLAVGSMAVFAIFLRERGSPESKPVGAPHHETAVGP